jgi:plastocyanin
MMKQVLILSILLLCTNAVAKTFRMVQSNKTFVGDVTDKEADAMFDDDGLLKAKKVELLKAKIGDKITFANRDGATHNVNASAGSDKIFDVGEQPPGAENDKTLEFSKKGEFEVRCAIHPKMKLKIVVE